MRKLLILIALGGILSLCACVESNEKIIERGKAAQEEIKEEYEAYRRLIGK